MAGQQWALDQEQRQETIRRTAENIFALAYSQHKAVTDREAAEAARIVEEKAYTVARIESQTTTGQRPADESLKAYTRYTWGVSSRRLAFLQFLTVHISSPWVLLPATTPCYHSYGPSTLPLHGLQLVFSPITYTKGSMGLMPVRKHSSSRIHNLRQEQKLSDFEIEIAS